MEDLARRFAGGICLPDVYPLLAGFYTRPLFISPGKTLAWMMERTPARGPEIADETLCRLLEDSGAHFTENGGLATFSMEDAHIPEGWNERSVEMFTRLGELAGRGGECELERYFGPNVFRDFPVLADLLLIRVSGAAIRARPYKGFCRSRQPISYIY